MTKIVGVTGTIGSGKSTVGEILAELGVPVIDTDLIVHELLSQDGAVRHAVIERFGARIVAEDGSGAVDRSRLGELVFKDSKARRGLESIIHPAVIVEFRRRLDALADHPLVAVLVPLLFEAGIAGEFDEIWAVVTEEKILRERLKARDGMTDEELDRRLAAQWSQVAKTDAAHRIVGNSGSKEETRRQVELLVSLLQEP